MPAGTRHASTSTPTAAWRAAFEAVYSGTFKAIRSSAVVRKGPYSGSKVAPRPAATSPFSTFARASIRQAPRAHFGPRPRPVGVSGTSQAGLGAARQFSSSGFAVFDNVVANVPLALRALADEGLDQRKWKRVKRDVTRRERATRKAAVKSVDSRAFDAEKRAEFERFFGSVAAIGASVNGDALSVSGDAVATPIEPVTLILAVDPDFELPLTSGPAPGDTVCGAFLPDPVPERVLSPHALASFEIVTNAYASHAHRLRSIINRLSSAGLLDPEVGATSSVGTIRLGDGLDFDQVGRRVWKVVFEDSLVTRSRVDQVVRGLGTEACSSDEPVPGWARKVRSWTGRNSVTAGEGDWWWLLGGEAPTPGSLPVSPESAPASPSEGPPSEVDDRASLDDEAARLVASAFVLPDPPSLGFDFDVAPTPASSSSVSSCDDSSPRDIWCTSPDDTGASFSRSSSPLDPAASVWADAEEIVSHGTVETESLFDEDEEDRSGIERFLEEVEDLQDRRTMRFL